MLGKDPTVSGGKKKKRLTNLLKYSTSIWPRTLPGQYSMNISACNEAKHSQNKKT